MNPKYSFPKQNFLSYLEASKIIHKANIKSKTEWYIYSKSDTKPLQIPAEPRKYYLNKGWIDWKDWLGYSERIYGEGKRLYSVNNNFFKIWSHDMAYILGFWFADGHIRKTQNNSCIFSIKQHIKDKYSLEGMLKILESNYPIHVEGKSCHFAINSEEIYRDIIKLGGKERKSLDGCFPDIPKSYLPDFIRGLWDGDGSISRGHKNRKGRSYKACLSCGSRNFIYKVKGILEESIKGLKVKIYERFKPKGSLIIGNFLKKDSLTYNLTLTVNGTRMLRDFMYNGHSSLMLIRKYEKFRDSGDIFIRSV